MTSPVNYVEPFWGSGAMWLCHPAWGDPCPFPVPYFGGKRAIARMAWERFGCATLPKAATGNDLHCFVPNTMRAMVADPEAVARWCDWPVSEVDLFARHRWLLRMAPLLRARLEADPMYSDPRIAGWWIWGASQWVGSGWCDERAPKDHWRQPPAIGADSARGALALSMREPTRRIPSLGGSTDGRTGSPLVCHGKGALGAGMREPGRQIPALSGNYGSGDLARESSKRQLPGLNRNSSTNGVNGQRVRTRLDDVFDEIQRRLRPVVRFACGDFERVLTPAVTYRHGLTAVFLDPVYLGFEYVYGNLIEEGQKEHCARRAEAWAREAGKRDDMRIALCGYEGDYDLPGWEVVAWKANGGYSNRSGENENAHRERVWFSPACLKPGVHFGQASLF